MTGEGEGKPPAQYKGSSGHSEVHRRSQAFPEEIGVLTSSAI